MTHLSMAFYWWLAGDHVHVRVFTGWATEHGTSRTKCGDLVFRAAEWAQFRCMLELSGYDVLPDPNHPSPGPEEASDALSGNDG
jgi:hypothetical protein